MGRALLISVTLGGLGGGLLGLADRFGRAAA